MNIDSFLELSTEFSEGLQSDGSNIRCDNSTINSDGSTIRGNNNIINGDGNTIRGNNNVIKGDGNTIRGNNNSATGDGNHARGNNNHLRGDGCVDNRPPAPVPEPPEPPSHIIYREPPLFEIRKPKKLRRNGEWYYLTNNNRYEKKKNIKKYDVGDIELTKEEYQELEKRMDNFINLIES